MKNHRSNPGPGP